MALAPRDGTEFGALRRDERRDTRPRRRPREEEPPDAGEDRLGDLELVNGIFQPLLVRRVGDERGLDEHRRDVRRLEHDESSVLNAGPMHARYAAQGSEYR